MNTHFARCLQNVECEFCEFEVTDGPLTGNFVARNNLILKTKSNAIDANVTMISRVNSTTEAQIPSRPVVDITTTTGSLYANFTLIAVDAGTEERLLVGGAYEITTRSRQASVRLEVVDAPVDSALKLFSKNMRGLLEVWLHPTYQGRLLSESLTGSISQRLHGLYGENPFGSDRKSSIFRNGWSILPGIKHVLSGEVWWGDQPEHPFPYNCRPYDLICSEVQLKTLIGVPFIALYPSGTSVFAAPGSEPKSQSTSTRVSIREQATDLIES